MCIKRTYMYKLESLCALPHTLDDYQVCHGVDCSFKMGVILHEVRSENQRTVLLEYLIISTNVSNKMVHWCTLHSKQSDCYSAKLPTSFYLSSTLSTKPEVQIHATLPEEKRAVTVWARLMGSLSEVWMMCGV